MSLGIIILAGGKSSRMGQDKGLVRINNKPLIQYIIDSCTAISKNIIIISNQDGYENFGYPVFEDDYKNKGPIGGIYTGLKKSTASLNLILSCDSPFISTELIQQLIAEIDTGTDIVVPKHKGRVHPLMGIYKSKVAETALKQIQTNGLKVMRLLDEVKTTYFNADHVNSNHFINLNKPDDLKQFEDLISGN